ncbi:MAG: hypothetical protein KDA65_04890 [Planctomycetaceae bacterium]|nr:hypothetical protein [Planctomycetaceae bacterium]
MVRTKHIYLALATLALGFSLINITVASEGEGWKIEITPRFTLDRNTKQTLHPVRQTAHFRVAQAETLTVPEPESELASTTQMPQINPAYTMTEIPVPNYNQIYKSIPYSRAQYLANPSYRHDATMSIILGQPYVTNGPKEKVERVPDAVKTSPWSKTTPWFNSGGNLFPFPGAVYGFSPYGP